MLARSEPANAFARAAARLAGRAALLVERDGQDHVTAAAQEALGRAADAANEVERLSRLGHDLREAYLRAAQAMDAAAEALESLARHDRPWLHIVHRRPRAPVDDVST
ncbi:MAG: hypothetical protein QOE90_1971 [Thermoplasmata archaeon]|jgi:anion-transporting  ArsA/GET3 family ATPase|nr:hypothetical protein [Thermoplasmata archaeon]